MQRPFTRREERFNTWLSVALLLGIVVLGNLLAADRLTLRRDLSEDQLFTLAPATQRILGGLTEPLQVRTYFTRDTELGDVQLARARVEAQLAELRALARGRLEVVDFDPVTSSSARTEALRSGVRPRTEVRVRATETVEEEIWLGVVLRQRGREQVIPYIAPWRFEVQFAAAVHALQRDRPVVVGLYGMPLTATVPTQPEGQSGPAAEQAALAREVARGWPTFGAVAALLARTREVREVRGLEEGLPVAGDIDVVVAVASQPVHERAVFELDRFVQRGGALLLAVDDPVFNWRTGQARPAAPRSPLDGELGNLLGTLGIEVWPRHLWDLEPAAHTTHGAYRRGGAQSAALVTSPAVLSVRRAGLSQELPPTRDLDRVTFWWAHPLRDSQKRARPSGVRREDLAWTSPRARLAGVLGALPSERDDVVGVTRSVSADPGGRYVLAAAFTGALPSAFAGRPVPLARDPLSGPGATAEVPAAPLPADARPGTIVVVGDADWLRDPAQSEREGLLMEFAQGGGALFLENLVDWLTLDEDLIGLRSRVPRDRPLVDFVAEARAAEGLVDADPFVTETERRARELAEDRATAAARRRRWRTLLAPIAAALTLVLAVGFGWNLYERRRAAGAGR